MYTCSAAAACCIISQPTVCEIQRSWLKSMSALATSTPRNEATGSIFQPKKQERVERLLTGTSRSSYRLDPGPVLEHSLLTSESDLSQEMDTAPPR